MMFDWSLVNALGSWFSNRLVATGAWQPARRNRLFANRLVATDSSQTGS